MARSNPNAVCAAVERISRAAYDLMPGPPPPKNWEAAQGLGRNLECASCDWALVQLATAASTRAPDPGCRLAF